jgi:hypothetical protein
MNLERESSFHENPALKVFLGSGAATSLDSIQSIHSLLLNDMLRRQGMQGFGHEQEYS